MVRTVSPSAYSPRQLEYIRSKFRVLSESEWNLTVASNERELQRLARASYKTDEEFKTIFWDL